MLGPLTTEHGTFIETFFDLFQKIGAAQWDELGEGGCLMHGICEE